MPNGVTETRTYDALNRMQTTMAFEGMNLVYGATYGFDLIGNRRTVQEEVQGQAPRTVAYDYDEQYRLTSETDGVDTTTYTYDLAGNRLTKVGPGISETYVYNARNELETITTGMDVETRLYDLNGNLTQRTNTSGTTTYSWDVPNRLVAASDAGGEIFSAQYDYRTRRIVKRDAGAGVFYVHTGGLTLREVDLDRPSGQPVEYVHGLDMGGGIGAMIYAIKPATGNLSSTSRREFFTSNHLGHTVALTDLSGAVTQTELFEAFGESRSTTGSSSNTRRAYTKERDESLGFDCHGFRYYEPATGRYISRDPAGYPDGMNVYLHVRNNPINRFDPVGLEEASLQEYKSQGFISELISSAKVAAYELFNRDAVQTMERAVYDPALRESLYDPLKGSMFSPEAQARAAAERMQFESGAVTSPDLVVDVATGGFVGLAGYGAARTTSAAFGFAKRELRAHRIKKAVERLDVKTGRNSAVFYSGEGQRELALEFAKREGKRTIDMTGGGQWLTNQGNLYDQLGSRHADAIWGRLSERFANEASGNAVGFVRGAKPDRIFELREYPTLLRNPNITNVITGGD